MIQVEIFKKAHRALVDLAIAASCYLCLTEFPSSKLDSVTAFSKGERLSPLNGWRSRRKSWNTTYNV